MVNRGQLLFGAALFGLIFSLFGLALGLAAIVVAYLNGGLTLVGLGLFLVVTSGTSFYALYRWFASAA